MLRKTESGKYEAVKLSKTFAAHKTYEQERLRKQFSKEKDVVIQRDKTDKKSWYVKVRSISQKDLPQFREV